MDGAVDWSGFEEPTGAGGSLAAYAVAGEPPVWRSWGRSEPTGSPLDPETPFYAGSIAKQFTAACVASLIIDDELTLDTPVPRLLPRLPACMDNVEIGHLITHTSGLPDSNALDAKVGFGPRSSLSNADRLAALADIHHDHRPGAVHRYSNLGYVILAEVVSTVASAPFGQYAADELLRPAGMSASAFLDVGGVRPIPGWSSGERVDLTFTSVGDGGLITTVADLFRWNSWLPSSPLAPLMLGPRLVMATGLTAHDAWGISIRTHRGQRIESHGGAFDGYLCSAVRFPDLDAAFIAMTNTDERGATAFSAGLRHLVDSVLADHLDPDADPWTVTHGRTTA